MSTLVNWNGQQYLVPSYNDTGYAQGNGNLSQYLVAISTGSLQQVGGLFQLTADADFGPNFGLVSSYYKSRSANIASAGVLRLANTDAIKWRNSDNSADVTLAMNATGTAARTYTIPDLATSSFVMTEGTQSINGSKTFGSAIIGSLTGAASLNLLLTGGTMSGNIAMGGFKLTGLAAGSGNGDSLRYEQLVGAYLPLSGGTMVGNIAMSGTQKLTGLVAGSTAGDSVRYEQALLLDVGGTITQPVLINNTAALHLYANDVANQHTILKLNTYGTGANDRAWRFIVGKNADSAWGNYSLRLMPYNSVSTGDLVFGYGGGDLRIGKGSADTADATTNFTEHLGISQAGEITQPLQPCFLVLGTGATNVTGDGTTYTCVFGTEVFDQGGDFASNVFTAPVTGKYQFNASVEITGIVADNTDFTVYIVTSNRSFTKYIDEVGSAVYLDGSLSILADMDAGDIAYVTIRVGGVTKGIDTVTSSSFNFSGSLIN